MKNFKLSTLVKISMLSAVAFLLMFIELPLPIFPQFLKLDVSDIPALIGGFALGPVSGIIIEFVKNLLHGLFKGGTAFIGELANFIIGSILVYVSSYIYNKRKTKSRAVLGLILGTVAMSLVAAIVNKFVLLPLYEKILNFPMEAIVSITGKVNPKVKDVNSFLLWGIVPFNLLKGIIVSVITTFIYKGVSPIIHKESENKTVVENSL